MYNLDALLQYNFDVSAKNTRQVLGVITRQNDRGVKEEVLTVIDLKTLNCFQKIKLWWFGQYTKETVADFVENHSANWYSEVGNTANQLKFEKQLAILRKKFQSTDKTAMWKLNITLKFPSIAQASNPIQERRIELLFDRMTENAAILQRINSLFLRTGLQDTKTVTVAMKEIFSSTIISGEYRGENEGLFINDRDKGGERTCVVEYRDLDQKRLLDIVFFSGVKAGYQFAEGRQSNFGHNVLSPYEHLSENDRNGILKKWRKEEEHLSSQAIIDMA